MSQQSQAHPLILIVEDETSIASFVAMYLKKAGYEVKVAGSGTEALARASADHPSLIILDLMLPDLDGIEVCRRIRQRSDIPILMLTARDDDVDKIIGLEVGADDYLTKPFNPRELVARVKSVLRRSAPKERELENSFLEHGLLRIDSGRREVMVGDEEVQLAPKEFDLLWSCSTIGASCSPATSSSSGSGGTPSPATRVPSTCTSASSAESSETRARSSRSGASATRSRPSRRPLARRSL